MSILTEKECRNVVGEEMCRWLDDKGFYYSNQLPFSGLEGWTTGWMSLICDDEGLTFESIEELEKHYQSCRSNHEKKYG